PADQADVVRRSFFDDAPHADIARALNVPLGTVKSRIRLAMQRLRSLVEDIK
ncbi:MAG: RNA polymerase subunit sigma, partial [Alphaproteobacteria bacterium]|nr:RNA polymerase subunit sigma [Alphaproteobacteria bacterium]